MTTRQLFCLSVFSIAVNRTFRLAGVLCRHTAACSDDGLSSRKAADLAHDLPAFGEYGRSATAVNRAIYSASAQQGGVRGIHHCIGRLPGNVGRTLELDRLVSLEYESNCKIVHARIQTDHFLSVSASTPGSFFPSKNSSEAPPPLEICVILSSTSAPCTAETVSPPPTIEIAHAVSATAWPTLKVPRENPGSS